jgi:hypothetical protein
MSDKNTGSSKPCGSSLENPRPVPEIKDTPGYRTTTRTIKPPKK